MPTVRIPRALRTLTCGQSVVTAEGINVRQLIDELDLHYPGLKQALMCGDKLQAHVLVAVDGQVALLGARQPLAGIEEVTFLPAISGG